MTYEEAMRIYKIRQQQPVRNQYMSTVHRFQIGFLEQNVDRNEIEAFAHGVETAERLLHAIKAKAMIHDTDQPT